MANLFMHYAFDLWMTRNRINNPFERYADDTVVHCRTEQEARQLLADIDARLKDCKLELHPTKTKIVYCQDKDRQKEYPNIEFDFLGYTFRKVCIKDRTGRLQMNFIASVSKKAEQTLKDKVKTLEIHKRTGSKINMIAEVLNPILRGWMNYFGKFNRSAMKRAIDCVQRRLIKWAMCKYKKFRGHRRRAEEWLGQVRKREPNMFAHWTL
ncbi:MAG: group II intron maturase-specific domain-containing protein [Bacillota bacterium]